MLNFRMTIMLGAVFCTACTSTPSPVVELEAPVESRDNTAANNVVASNNGWRLTEPAPSSEQKVQTHSSASAVTSLVNQARDEYTHKNYSRAIALAERGLRINRRNPQLYLILAESYWQQLLPVQAKQFAQKGLRYSRKDSEVYGLLSSVLGQ